MPAKKLIYANMRSWLRVANAVAMRSRRSAAEVGWDGRWEVKKKGDIEGGSCLEYVDVACWRGALV